jgi:hypothetical protein
MMSENSDDALKGKAEEVSDLDLGALEDEELEPEPTEAEAGPRELAQIVKRCEIAGIEYARGKFDDGDSYLRLAMPAGRKSRSLTVADPNKANALLAVPFERYRYLEGYEAICSYDDGVIEAAVRSAGPGFAMPTYAFSRLFGQPPQPGDDVQWPPRLEFRDDREGADVALELGPRSDVANVLLNIPGRRGVSFFVRGAKLSRHDQARSLLESYAHALFFQVDAKVGLPIELTRERRREMRRRRLQPLGSVGDLTFPHTMYDREPMSLFWYARGALGMPLLQFLAYYQVIEFYFPVYAQEELRRRLRNVVNDPAFSPHSERDIGRLVDVMSATGGRTVWGDERSQLRATLAACLDADGIRRLISSDVFDGYFDNKVKGLTSTTLRSAAQDEELVSRTAERIYEIRCKIVHTKDERPEGETGLLLPFSPEADRLGPDIELVEYVSRRVLAAGGRPLVV